MTPGRLTQAAITVALSVALLYIVGYSIGRYNVMSKPRNRTKRPTLKSRMPMPFWSKDGSRTENYGEPSKRQQKQESNSNMSFHDLTSPLTAEEQAVTCRQVSKDVQPPFHVCLHSTAADRFISGGVAGHGGFEGDVSYIIKQHLKAQPAGTTTVIDIGANIGVHSMYPAVMGAPVIAVEPSKKNWARIKKGAQLNKVQDHVKLLPYAMSDKRETVTMAGPPGNMGGTQVVRDGQTAKGPTFTINTLLLDDLIPLVKTPNLIIKMDIEAHECYAIRSGQKMFDKFNVLTVIMEYGVAKKQDIPCRKEMHDSFKRRGYVPYFSSPPPPNKQVVIGKDYPGNIAWVKQGQWKEVGTSDTWITRQ